MPNSGCTAYASELRERIRIVRLKPVAKRAPQKPISRPRGAAFDYVVLAVKEVGGIAGIKGKRLKAGERSKNR
jgi:hypothetical protein